MGDLVYINGALSVGMQMEKACSIPYRLSGADLEVLAFRHPLAGKQFVKGSVEAGEAPADASVRELLEESGVDAASPMYLGTDLIGLPPVRWHFYAFETHITLDAWNHSTEDDGGHTFSFFWHPIAADLDEEWHPIFHQAYRFIRDALLRRQ